MSFSNLHRKEFIENLTSQSFDVLIIGGGITGAGIALDATTRGMSVALVEMQDFAAGTSSRSTKLVHGGLRYLKQLEVKMVAEVGRERAIVYENGPHVTTPEWMLLPFHKGGTFGSFTTSIGLMAYDLLAGVKKGERRMMLSAKKTLDREPLIKREGLRGGGFYVEYRTDDARLTVETMKKAVEKGATALNYAKVNRLLYNDGIICGAVVEDVLTGEEFEIRAKKIVNATGPWVDNLRVLDNSKKGKFLRLSKGVHIVIDHSRFPLRQAIYFDTPDGRMVFAIPRAGKAYVGTTDTFYEGDPANPEITEADRTYLLKAIDYMFPNVNITDKDIESTWAGVRPLIYEEGKAPSEISRKDEIWESETGLITIAGGKLTGYRKMAETITDLLVDKLSAENGRSLLSCQTKHLPISGGDVGGAEMFETFVESLTLSGVEAGLTAEEARHLSRMYGSNAPRVFQLATTHKEEASRFRLPSVLFAKLAYAIEDEMAVTPTDFFNRRTGAVLFDIQTVLEWKDAVVDYFAYRFGWNDEEKQRHLADLEQAIAEAAGASQ
ncbi:glycerol-3-phosphate dehydrogenase [Bacillus sp. FJAT-18017]|uniref:glycerol-3-phosphate dehydrogenase/oxidase n=1 Tax=Bacillus sp. FJAT-18017 TaxID=1705566 RepID=UPI0006B01DA7|nr:glycerol-3-phosphate dehydrogenase/oxidase [Bacillus sp. FJAT-18017]ALC92950.1 glycerol-3-phosphate dehydrogenase [Bacillus sp. FJAT-18017]